MIPKIIWQTYESSFIDLPKAAKNNINTWKSMNPEYEYFYMSSEERKKFVFNNFDSEWNIIFNKFDYGIVQANIWRCMIIYKNGGMYCDLDTICEKPLSEWINNNSDLIISNDDDTTDIAIFAFFASKNNEILKDILDQIKINLSRIETINIKNVVKLTGEDVWTKIINKKTKKLKNIEQFNIQYVKNTNTNYAYDNAIYHLGTTKKWSDDGYIQWNNQ